MPNWVKNNLIAKGTKEQLAELATFLHGENGDMDFNSIDPMPKDLSDVICYANKKEYIACYLSDKFKITYSGLLKKDPQISALIGKDAYNTLRKRYIDKDDNSLNKMYEIGKAYDANMKKYGFPTWYEWALAHWGTKWNASSPSLHELTDNCTQIEFDTAWSGVFNIVKTISKQFPTLSFTYKYADEDAGYNTGHYTLKNGRITRNYNPQDNSPEAYALVKELWGDDFLDDDDEEEYS